VFEATSFGWMVVAGEQIFVKGVGMLNGQEHQVLVSAVDGKPDLIRVKIWQGRNRAAVYDSQRGAADDARPTTQVVRGSLTIERTKSSVLEQTDATFNGSLLYLPVVTRN
jgi:hypothetical protein